MKTQYIFLCATMMGLAACNVSVGRQTREEKANGWKQTENSGSGFVNQCLSVATDNDGWTFEKSMNLCNCIDERMTQKAEKDGPLSLITISDEEFGSFVVECGGAEIL